MVPIVVRNLNGTSTHHCGCDSWLAHWAKYSPNPIPTYCCALGCSGTQLLGAHVQLTNSDNNNWYIVPLCIGCNNASRVLHIAGSTVMVNANESESCARSLGAIMATLYLKR